MVKLMLLFLYFSIFDCFVCDSVIFVEANHQMLCHHYHLYSRCIAIVFSHSYFHYDYRRRRRSVVLLLLLCDRRSRRSRRCRRRHYNRRRSISISRQQALRRKLNCKMGERE